MDLKGACLLTYLLYAYSKPRQCINIHHYTPPRIVMQQAAVLHALHQQYTSEGSTSSFNLNR